MWIVLLAPIIITFGLGLVLFFSAASAKSACGVTVRLFGGGLCVLLAGYCVLLIITKIT
ncbi:hypothetical protein [Pseudomonas phage D6]|nr:hypothetical protein [Pseudomonas phage D6]